MADLTLIEKLREKVILGGGYADIHTEELEALIAMIPSPEAAEELRISADRKALYDDLMAGYDRLRADTDAAIKARLKARADGGNDPAFVELIRTTIAETLADRGEIIVKDWQPIETAPKDGTFILVFCPEDDSRWLAAWQGSRHSDASWYGVDDLGLTRSSTHYIVNSWMPLPEPPSKHARSKP